MTRAEAGRRWREHQRVIWKYDPERRAAYLAAHRAEALARERARGRRPLTFEIASARSRLAWQRRRTRAAAAGLVMASAELRELRTALGMTQRELGAAVGFRRSSIELWELNGRGPPAAAVERLRAVAREHDLPADPVRPDHGNGAHAGVVTP